MHTFPKICPHSLPHCGIFKPLRDVHFSYGGVKNGMLYRENAKVINKRLTIFVTDMKP